MPLSGNDPAFPTPDQRDPVTGEGIMQGSPGLSRRDYFAAAALTGLLAYPEAHLNCGTAPDAARTAYELADAMIAASKTGGPEHA